MSIRLAITVNEVCMWRSRVCKGVVMLCSLGCNRDLEMYRDEVQT